MIVNQLTKLSVNIKNYNCDIAWGTGIRGKTCFFYQHKIIARL